MTNAHSEAGQMADYCQNLTLGALSSRSSISVLVGALLKKFGLFLNTPCLSTQQSKDSVFYWRITPCTMINGYKRFRETQCCHHFYTEDSDSSVVRNAGNYLSDYTASHPRRKQ
jgi:hypothetical protein